MEEFQKRKQEEFEKKYITYNSEEVHVSEFDDKSVDYDMKKGMRMNSYAQDDLTPKLTDEALIETAKYYQSNCTKPKFPCATYNDAIIHNLLPELLKRLEERSS